MSELWLVAGLGNPGATYEGTRHNVGAAAVEELARGYGVSLSANRRVKAAVAQVRAGGTRLVLAVPSTYMNRSGGPVQSTARWFKIDPAQIVVCHDDLDVPLGAIRVKRGGGHAGHNGLRDVDRALGTRDYLRVRIGIGRPPGMMPGRDYVLQRFGTQERDEAQRGLQAATWAVEGLVTEGLAATQNRFHGA